MTAQYTTVAPTVVFDRREALAHRVLRIFIFVYWLPCVLLDAFLLAHDGLSAGEQVFWLVFDETTGFLAIWFVFSVVKGLLLGSSAEPARKRRSKRR